MCIPGGAESVIAADVTIPRREYELLLLKKRALDSIKEGITIADCSQPDMPIIYANEAFARLTGYSTEYAIGRNCRFLQGCDEVLCIVWGFWFCVGDFARVQVGFVACVF